MIETVSKNNLDEVLPLIRAYQEFYHVADISDERNLTFFSQFGQASHQGCQFLYREEHEVVGFATVYFSFSSTMTAKVAILNVLFVLSQYRGKGIGRQLIEHCRSYASSHGASRLQWLTAPDNDAAKKLYESLNTAKSNWQLYTYEI